MSQDNYAIRQREHNAAYSQAYADWVAKLSPKKRRELQERGLLDAQVDAFETGKPDQDACFDRIAADGEVCNDPPAEQDAANEVREEAMSLVRSILGEIMSQDNTRLALDCFALVTGVGYMGDSMTTIARRHKVTRAAVSKRCVMIGDALNLPPSRAMRRLTARKAYERRANKHHAGTGH